MNTEHNIWIALIATALLTIGFLGGFWAGYATPVGEDAHHDAHADEHHHEHDEEHGHSHNQTVEAQQHIQVSLEAHPDSVDGYNIHINTTNFSFAPHHAGHEHTPGEGHAHLYANGEKIARAYGEWHKIGDYPEGTQLTVGLYSNDHRLYSHDGQPVEDTITLDS